MDYPTDDTRVIVRYARFAVEKLYKPGYAFLKSGVGLIDIADKEFFQTDLFCEGQRVKAAKEISLGVTLSIRQDLDEKMIIVIALSDQRRGAPEAALLYQETPESAALREKRSAERKAGIGSFIVSDHKPNKKERRQIHQFQRDTAFDNN